MATCSAVAEFLQQAQARSITGTLAPEDLASLQQLQLVRQLTPSEIQQVEQRVASIQAAQQAMAQEVAQRQQAAAGAAADARRSHSILFHLEGVDHQHATLERLQAETAAVKQLDDDLAKRQQEFAQLLVDKSLLDSLAPFGGNSLALTTAGRVALRDLQPRLYRVGDRPFATYWQESLAIDGELHAIADASARIAPTLQQELMGVENAYLWAIAIGLVKSGGDPAQRLSGFLNAHRRLHSPEGNPENTLMAAEILALDPRPLDQTVPMLEELVEEIHPLGVPPASQVGVASILLMGQRADGSFATEPLRGFLSMTPSQESAALLAINNQPFQTLAEKFQGLRSLFGSWGYSFSEDMELSSAFLAISDLPAESVGPKLAILARGLGGYLQYPLVAASILASIPVLEANETLNLVEKAYEVMGQRTGPMSQAELISLAVRAVHGIDVRSVDAIDPTALVAPSPPGFSYANVPVRLWAPVFIIHGSYYSTFSGIGGMHPGHVHVWGGGGFTG